MSDAPERIEFDTPHGRKRFVSAEDYEALQAQIENLQKIISESEAHRYRSVGELLIRAEAAEAALDAERAKVAALVEALTPSGETKAAYIGDFSFFDDIMDEDGNEVTVRVTVPWTTIKEIMAAIRTRAAIAAAKGESHE